MIITFYSYKGGTGRTMALANVAALLARRGYRVLAVDFDLEAPGLWRYFSGFRDRLDQQPGLIDLLAAAASTPGHNADWRNYLTDLPIKAGPLTLMTSGQLDGDYSSRVLGFDWTEFFQNARGGEFLEQLRQQWRDAFDFTLIDSRTGITDTGGICTIMLPDMIIPVFVSNHQSIDGAVEVITRAQAGRKRLAYDRPPAMILPIFSRFEGRAEYQTAQQWLDIAADRVQPFYSDWLPSGFNPRRALERTKLPYVTYFSFGEQLPALVDSTSDPESLGYALNVVSQLIEQRLENAEVILGGTADGHASPSVPVTRAAEGAPREALIQRAPSGEPPEAGQSAVVLRLRVGITGHRDLTADHPELVTEIANAVEYISELLATDPERIRSGETVLTAVSSLAEGADRLVAEEILKRPGSQLEIVLPMPADEYRHDFGSPASVAEFDEFLNRPGATIDTTRVAGPRDQAYEAAGRAVVDRSDVMIVVWNGEPAAGRGGTAEIHAYAQRWQKPIVLISVDQDSARLDSDRLPRTAAGQIPLPAASLQGLDQYNAASLPDPDFAASAGQLPDIGAQPGFESSAQLYRHISRYFARADGLANQFQGHWFWATRWLYILAPAAILAVAAQVSFVPDTVGYAGIEFAILIIIIAVLLVARRARWHQRWVSARYLAEQIRSLLFLGLTGIVTLDRSVAATDRQAVAESSWAERAANEIWFTRPRLDQQPDFQKLKDLLLQEWIKGQQKYHRKVYRTYGRRSRVFQLAAIGLFVLSAVAALLHSLNVAGTVAHPFKWWDFLAIAIPGIAAALGGYAAQRDYTRHAERSRLFTSTLDSAAERLLTARNLPDIQQAALTVSRAMRSESVDWYTVVHSQDVELPS